MKIKLFLVLSLVFCFSAYSQTTFQPGYLVRTNGTKIKCLIKNEDWRNNPVNFQYKLNRNGEIQTGNRSNVKEFGIDQIFKFVRADVEMDRSEDSVGNLSSKKAPDFKKEQLFLRALVEGKANLYSYREGNLKRYFFKMDNGGIEQLIYKKYRIKGNVGENKRYKQQLFQNLHCPELEFKDFQNLEYEEGDLMDLFKNYNTCKNSGSLIYQKDKKRKDWFHLNLRPGVNFSSLSITKKEEIPIEFGSKTGFRIGLEAEFILPFNNNKWALFIEPTYHSYSGEQEVVISNFGYEKGSYLVSANYTSIEIPIGGRHYFFLNQDAALFVNAAVIVDVMLPSKIEFSKKYDDMDIKPNLGFAVGAGFKYKNRYSIEARFQPSRQTLEYVFWDSSYTSFSVIFGYTLF